MFKVAKGSIALLLVLALVLCTAPAFAAAKPKIVPQTLWAGDGHCMPPTLKNVPASAKLVSIKSSKPKIIEVIKFEPGMYGTVLKPIKPGKSVITVKYKDGKETHTLKATYTVKKYPNECKSVTVNGRKVNLKKYPYWYIVSDYKKDSITIKVNPVSGWKVTNCVGYSMDSGEEVKIRNGKSCALPEDESVGFHFTLKKTKTGEVIDYTVNVMR